MKSLDTLDEWFGVSYLYVASISHATTTIASSPIANFIYLRGPDAFLISQKETIARRRNIES